ncbi:MAG: sigma-70 family RNA polymerase sigma factor [Verrucomicrobia bacterium]|nr:sigma-70 family RNA polymerase sigma factor [Verrucomicrobiota bacterium]
MNTASEDEQDRRDMARLAGGHGAALNELMARHAPRLFGYLNRVLHDEDEAADLAQETFLRVHQHRGNFRSDGKFSTWLYTIATNLARDRQRSATRHPQVSLESENPATGDDFRESLPESRPSPVESLQSEERGELVRRAVAALPEDLRTPLILAAYEDRSQVEIAVILDCSPKAVEMRIYRARQQLRTSLGKMLELV